MLRTIVELKKTSDEPFKNNKLDILPFVLLAIMIFGVTIVKLSNPKYPKFNSKSTSLPFNLELFIFVGVEMLTAALKPSITQFEILPAETTLIE